MGLSRHARIERLVKRIENSFPPEYVNWLGPCSEKRLVEVERALGVKLPLSYRDFVKARGGGGYEFFYIIGIRPGEPTSDASAIGRMAKRLRDSWVQFPLPTCLVPIHYDPDLLAPFCLDTSRTKRGECPVVEYQLSTGDIEDVASDFVSFYEEYMEPRLASTAKGNK